MRITYSSFQVRIKEISRPLPRLKGTVSVILIDPPSKDGIARFTKLCLTNYELVYAFVSLNSSSIKGRITKGRITKGRTTKGRITKGRTAKGRTIKR